LGKTPYSVRLCFAKDTDYREDYLGNNTIVICGHKQIPKTRRIGFVYFPVTRDLDALLKDFAGGAKHGGAGEESSGNRDKA